MISKLFPKHPAAFLICPLRFIKHQYTAVYLAMCFAALSCSFLVSYTRARAEGLGLDCKVGIARRAERFIVLGIPTAIWGPGNQGWMLLVILTLLAGVAAITTVQRISHVYRLTEADRRTALKGT